MHALGIRAERPTDRPARKLSEAEKAAKRIAVFDAICTKHGYSPSLLAKLETKRLGELVGAEGYPVLVPSALTALVNEYLKAKGNGNGHERRD